MEKNEVSPTKKISSPKLSLYDKTWSHTKSNVIKASHIWRISNFSYFFQQYDGHVSSGDFSSAVNNDIKWMLELSLNPMEDCIMVSLRIRNNEAEVKAHYKLIMYDAAMKEAKVMKRINIFTKESSSVSEEFCTTNNIFGDDKKILLNDELTIGCEIKFIDSVYNVEGSNCITEFIDSKSHSLNILEFMYKNQEFSDIKINVDGQTFRAHKAVLAAASPVFLAMFNSSMRETEQNFINIDDIDVETFEEMLRFIYTGDVKNIEKVADTLFVAADKYDIDNLKHKCEKQLCKNLTVDNAIRILILADFHSLNWLKEQVITFMKIQRFDVTNTEHFNLMIDSHRCLLAEIIREFAT